MDRPTRTDVLMMMAEAVSLRATCQRAKVGVVVAQHGRVLSMGYNGSPATLPHCDHGPDEMGPDTPCQTSVHAEANAVAWAARTGVALHGATLVTTMNCCPRCAPLVVNAGVKKVVYKTPYRAQFDAGPTLAAVQQLFGAAGVDLEWYRKGR